MLRVLGRSPYLSGLLRGLSILLLSRLAFVTGRLILTLFGRFRLALARGRLILFRIWTSFLLRGLGGIALILSVNQSGGSKKKRQNQREN
jgi:hypothetical protein